MKICIVLGTRPEIIKFYSIIKYCQLKRIDFFIIHTNQHYSSELDKVFFNELELPSPKYNLHIGSGQQGEMTGKMLIEIERCLLGEKKKPDVVLVQGDTNSTLSGALAATKLNIPVAHVEAGLRSYDNYMPEEKNRIIIDHISDFLFCPTKKQADILKKEGVSGDKTIVVGNTVVDALKKISGKATKKILLKYGLVEKKYLLLTMHRPSNVDNKKVFSLIINNIFKFANSNNLSILFPVHPRTLNNIKKFRIKLPNNFIVVGPTKYTQMLSLIKYAKVIMTDSGGLQEEACALLTPCLVLRENTERPECVDAGASVLIGSSYNKMRGAFDYFSKKRNNWDNPFGDGKSADKILSFLINRFFV